MIYYHIYSAFGLFYIMAMYLSFCKLESMTIEGLLLIPVAYVFHSITDILPISTMKEPNRWLFHIPAFLGMCLSAFLHMEHAAAFGLCVFMLFIMYQKEQLRKRAKENYDGIVAMFAAYLIISAALFSANFFYPDPFTPNEIYNSLFP